MGHPSGWAWKVRAVVCFRKRYPILCGEAAKDGAPVFVPVFARFCGWLVFVGGVGVAVGFGAG